MKVTPDGKVKVLDFGLAKAWSGDAASGSAPDLSQSPTLAHTGTAAGLILGTAGYMSPEQARGRAVDKRADVWAFGVVLFEMLSGTRLFEGETVSDTLAAVLRQEIDWSALPSSTPPSGPLAAAPLPRARAEEAAPRHRRGAHRADGRRLERHECVSRTWSPHARRGAVARRGDRARRGGFLATREPRPKVEARLLQLDVQLADDLQLGSLLGHAIALSPDGTRLVFVGLSGSEPALYLRTLDQPTFTLLPDTGRAQQPFFSPDGREVGFFAGTELRRVSIAGGASNLIAAGGDARGASWGEDGTIVFSASQSGALMRVSATGGTPTPLTTLDPTRGERSHRWPSFLPGGRQLLMNVQARNLTYDDAAIELVDLESGRRRALDVTGAEPRFAEGQLLFARRGRLHAAPLDAASARLTGAPVVLAQGVYNDPRSGTAHYAVSQAGLIAFVQGQEPNAQRFVEWRDRAGNRQPFLERPALYLSPRFSPDGSRLAIQIGELAREDIYVADTAGGTLTRLTFDDQSDFSPVWSPDGTRILHVSISNNLYYFSIRNADGSGTPRKVYEAHVGELAIPTAWSSDGATVLFHESARGTGLDLRALDLASGEVRVLASTPFPEIDGGFSPDGRFVVYAAGSQGARQIYVRPFADGGGHWQLSSDGGLRPVWLRTGEIVYQRPGRPISDWISVPVRTSGASFVAGAPRALFRGRVDADAADPSVGRLTRRHRASPWSSRSARRPRRPASGCACSSAGRGCSRRAAASLADERAVGAAVELNCLNGREAEIDCRHHRGRHDAKGVGRRPRAGGAPASARRARGRRVRPGDPRAAAERGADAPAGRGRPHRPPRHAAETPAGALAPERRASPRRGARPRGARADRNPQRPPGGRLRRAAEGARGRRAARWCARSPRRRSATSARPSTAACTSSTTRSARPAPSSTTRSASRRRTSRGKVALVTGARVKIGYQAALKLLRAGAQVVATTRFPHDAARRYASEPDFADWKDRLQVHGLDLRHSPSVEIFCSLIDRDLGRLDLLVNNACQTVRRPPGFFAHLLEFEERAAEALPAELRPLVARHHESVRLLDAAGAVPRLAPCPPQARSLPRTPTASRPGGAAEPGWACATRPASRRSASASTSPRAARTSSPPARVDADLQQVDLRELNTWRLTLAEVGTPEMIEVQLVNAVAPFILCARLKPLMLRAPGRDKHVVNVSAMEGIFSRGTKTDHHPHTNMAKAALNMLTLTSARDYVTDGIHMNAVDTGWITDEDPFVHAARKKEELGFQPPLDIVDGAARVLRPLPRGAQHRRARLGQVLQGLQAVQLVGALPHERTAYGVAVTV